LGGCAGHWQTPGQIQQPKGARHAGHIAVYPESMIQFLIAAAMMKNQSIKSSSRHSIAIRSERACYRVCVKTGRGTAPFGHGSHRCCAESVTQASRDHRKRFNVRVFTQTLSRAAQFGDR
jgi:hypothetical protein